ncbi:MAG: transketolase [Candidatus Borkfalkiaceae bacterium]|nr:transketolase [Christensenellaceae bacterium]
MDFKQLERFSADIRITMLKEMAYLGSGHVGGSASIADVLAVLYGAEMKIDPANPQDPDRDRFVLSKGHCGPALYATLALKNFFPMEWLKTLNKGGTKLPSHADMKKTPGIDMSTGSLGQGISCAAGIALGLKMQKKDNYVYCIIGDGEMQEGQVYEALMFANQQKLDNFVVFLDWNKKQLDDRVEKICDPINPEEKFRAFGLDAVTCKGYDVKDIYEAIERAKTVKGKAHAIVLDTWKGMGMNFAEKVGYNHFLTVTDEIADSAIKEIENRLANGTYPKGDLVW